MKKRMQVALGLLHNSGISLSPMMLPMCTRTIQWMIMDQKRRRKRIQHVLIAGNTSHQG
jgi:hypothetical protein